MCTNVLLSALISLYCSISVCIILSKCFAVRAISDNGKIPGKRSKCLAPSHNGRGYSVFNGAAMNIACLFQ